MKRALVVLSVAVASCSAADAEPSNSVADAEPLSTDQLALPTPTHEAIQSTSTTTTEPDSDGLVTLFDGSSDIDPLDVAFDEDLRSNRPALPAVVSERWTAQSERFTLNDAFAFDGQLITWQESRDRVHSLVARDLASGEETWQFEADGWKFIEVEQSGDLLLVSATKSGESDDFVVDVFDGTELAVSLGVGSVGGLWGEGLMTRSAGESGEGFEVFDPRSAEIVASIVPVGIGLSYSIVSDSGDGLVELSRTDFRAVSDVIDIGPPTAGKRTVAAFSDVVLVLAGGELALHDRSGVRVDAIPFPGPYDIQPAFGISETLVVYELEGTTGVDVVDFRAKWSRPGIVNQLGVYGGEAFGTFKDQRDTEVFSIDTGETRCTLEDGLFRNTRDGFFDGSTAYNSECEPIWTIDEPDGSKSVLVNGGVLIAQRVDDQTVLRFVG